MRGRCIPAGTLGAHAFPGAVAVNKVILAPRPVRGLASDVGFCDRPCGRCAAPSVARRVVGWQIQRLEAGRYSGSAPVAVVEATDLGLGHDPSLARWLYLARPGSVAVERLVGP